MHAGFLCIETSTSHPGMVRIRPFDRSPTPAVATGNTTEPQVRLVVRFNDLEAARMHAHTALRRNLVDPDAGTYRASLAEAIAGVEAIGLRHQRVFIDPHLDPDTRSAIALALRRRRQRQARIERAWQIVGGLGIGLLILLGLGF